MDARDDGDYVPYRSDCQLEPLEEREQKAERGE